ncbi:cation diffusion facilitator family transporter [Cryobacterium sp. BB736]|uniref:cation diffusion facilitator family transporter n=1 Tax=Cryobacterium sp. BB736 TaxID=2746963 RepID=UPI001876C64B
MTRRFGRTELPPELQDVLKRAIRIEWITICFLVVTTILLGLVLGNSQAMKAAWLEDLLSLAPPIAFLVAVRVVNRPPSARYPYGHHRSIGVAHLVAAVALTAVGTFLIVDSLSGLFRAEHPTIGSVVIFGQQVWLGWLMIGALSLTVVPPIIFGRIKMELAEQLHDKVLYADADMNKADWMTAAGSMLGVFGIGLGIWWADAVVATLIGCSILWDGYKNLKAAITDLVDSRATTVDDSAPHPLIREVNTYLRSLPWVEAAGARVRDEGHVLHVEAFVVPESGKVRLEQLLEARDGCIDLDWKIEDIVIVPVEELPEEVGGPSRERQSERSG